MRTFFAATMFALSFTASAFDFKTGAVTLPMSVEGTIHATVEDICHRDVSAIETFKLISYNVEHVRIDQGYRENVYSLVFKVIYKGSNSSKDTFQVNVIDQIEDRSGSLQTYVVDYKTSICRE